MNHMGANSPNPQEDDDYPNDDMNISPYENDEPDSTIQGPPSGDIVENSTLSSEIHGDSSMLMKGAVNQSNLAQSETSSFRATPVSLSDNNADPSQEVYYLLLIFLVTKSTLSLIDSFGRTYKIVI